MKPNINIVITGVSSGIGKQLVLHFLQHPECNVIGISRNQHLLDELKSEADSVFSNHRLHLIAADISTEEGIAKTETFILSALKHVDILINNAGMLINQPFSTINFQSWRNIYSTNVFGPAQLIRALLPLLIKKETDTLSHIVNVSSIGGVQGSLKFPGLSAYSSSKSAIIGLTECLAEELKDHGIRTNALALGSVETEMVKSAFPQFKASKSANEMAAFIVDFALKGAYLFNGKTIQISDSTP